MLRGAIRQLPPAARCGLVLIALGRLGRGHSRRPALVAPAWAAAGTEAHRQEEAGDGPAHAWPPAISVVIPARDEAHRLAGVLEPLVGAPGVVEVLVVDDRSTDGTADVARAHGATVVEGAELPRGWVGKPWALQQGLVAARGDLIVFLDADVRPSPQLPAAVAELLAPQRDVERQLRAEAAPADGPTADRGDGQPTRIERPVDLASAQLAFTCPGIGQRLIHPALLTTLVYRLGPLDTTERIPASTTAINGQCFAVRRDALISAGGFALVSAAPTDDVALARALAGAGWRIAVADGSGLGSVRMYESATEALREWAGRSLALPGAASRPRQLMDLAIVWVVQAAPALRLWRALITAARARSVGAGAATLRPSDVALLALRGALQLALTRVYRVGVGVPGRDPVTTAPDPVALAAPLADPIAFAGLVRGTLHPVRRWRGRAIP
ncbi:MAG: glycosyltransferase family 2 protein [Patulibacter minatonensis]